MQVPQTAHPRRAPAATLSARKVRIDDHVRFGP